MSRPPGIAPFFDFAKTIAAFSDEFGPASAAERFTIIRADRGAGAQNLFTKNLRFRAPGQRSEQSNYRETKLFRPVSQIVPRGHSSRFNANLGVFKVPS